MSPLGLVLIGIGLLMIIIGVKGSQHSVMDAFKGTRSGGNTGNSGGSQQSSPPSTPHPKQRLM